MADSKSELSIVLPFYNEEKNLPLILEEFERSLPDYPFELICVENGSTDKSREVMTELLSKSKYSFARMVIVEKNQGYGFGIISGLHAAKGEFLAWSHSDLQCHPKDIFIAYEKLRTLPLSTKTVVKGRRINRPFNQLFVTVGMQILATFILGKLLTDINAQPKVFHKNVFEELKDPPNDFSLDLYLLYIAHTHHFTIETIPVVFGERLHGISNWNFGIISRYKTILNSIKYMFKLRNALL